MGMHIQMIIAVLRLLKNERGESCMKYIVDRLPKTKRDCDYSEWQPYPSFIEKTGRYICRKDGKTCNLDEEYPITCTSCRWLKVQ